MTKRNMTLATIALALTVTACGSDRTLEPVASDSIPLGPAVVSSVSVTFDSGMVGVGSSARARALAVDSKGAEVTGRGVTWSLRDGIGVATIAADGTVSALAPGTATVVASVDSVSGTGTFVVVERGAEAVVEPELPRIFLNTPYRPATGQSIVVGPGGSLQAALNTANRGDEIVLTAGATYTGNFILPAKRGTVEDGWIVIRTNRVDELPPEGTRVTRQHAVLMPKIVTPNSQAAIATALEASGYRLVGLEVTVAPAFTDINYGMLTLGDGSAKQNQANLVATDLVLDRVYVHGQATTNSTRCIAFNSARTVLTDSYVVECHAKGYDSQAVGSWNGPGPFRIVNNTLSAAGENVIFGGADPAIPGLVASDIEFRRNYLYAPSEWRGVWTRKNLFETKNAARVLVEGNVMDGVWLDGQVGFAVLLKSTNQSGGCRWCRSEDITFRLNVVRNAGAGINLAGWESGVGREVDVRLRRVLIEHSTFTNINVAPWNGAGRQIQIGENPSDVTIRNITMTSDGLLNSFVSLGRAPAGTRITVLNVIAMAGQYGFFGDVVGEGERALASLVDSRVANLVLIGSAAGRPTYPQSVRFASTLSTARAVAGAGADEGRIAQATAGVEIP